MRCTHFRWIHCTLFVQSNMNNEWLWLPSILEGKAQNKVAFPILTFSSCCVLGVSFTPWYLPLCRRWAEKYCQLPQLSLHRCVTRKWLLYFPWIVKVTAFRLEKHYYSLGFKTKLGKSPPSFHQLNVVKMQAKTKQVSFGKIF